VRNRGAAVGLPIWPVQKREASEAREIGPRTDVRTSAEGDVLPRLGAIEPELVRIRVDALVAVRRCDAVKHAIHVSGGAEAVVTIFAFWALSQLLIGLLFILVLFRYRAMIPLMYVLILAKYLGRIAMGLTKPIVTIETPPGATGNLVLIVVGVIGLVLSLRGEAESAQPESEPA
jgi:hypothetical protein